MSEQNSNSKVGSNDTQIFNQADIESNKTMAGLAYLIFFLPLIVCPDSLFAKFHANQGLLLLIVGFGGSFILAIIPILGWILLPFFTLATLGFGIWGLINGLSGKAKELPLIGKFRLLK